MDEGDVIKTEGVTAEGISEKPVLVYSLQGSVRGAEIVCLVFVAICLILAYNQIVPVVPGLVLALELYLFVKAWSNHPRKATFYESHLTMETAGLASDFHYDQISDVAKVNLFPIIGPRTQVQIAFKDIERPYTIPSNPMIRRLNVDLYSWLEEKQKRLSQSY
jgi:hypothetical protein